MLKYSLLMPYHHRQLQLDRTLAGFARLYGKREDWEVVIVATARSVPPHVDAGLPVRIMPERCWTGPNPCTRYNLAARSAGGEFLILTSPEVAHEVTSPESR